jgi:hypothetical protein
MKQKILTMLSITLFLGFVGHSNAQTKALDFTKSDANGVKHHLFDDLDAGNAVILFFYMPNCGMCPPPAQKVQSMAKNINARYPGKVKIYVMPYNNNTKASDVKNWVNNYSLNMFTPLDSGATQVAHYGGFGMPSVALVAGKDHRIMFSDVGFSSRDTTDMRDSMKAFFNASQTGIEDLQSVITSLNIYPNPSSEILKISLQLKEGTLLSIDILDLNGRKIATVMNEKLSAGLINEQFNTKTLPNGNYFLRVNANGKTSSSKIQIIN